MGARTAIVGAGLAGLTVARRLREAGDEVVLFEKARGPGGRCATRRTEHTAFDHGAQYFTARRPAFIAQLRRWCEAGVVARWDGPFHALRAGKLVPAEGGGERYVGVPRMSALTRHLARDLEIRAQRRIESVERDERGWRLSDDSGASHEAFDRVVVATPAPQAVPLLAARPELARAAAQAALAPCQAVMATFAEPLAPGLGGVFVEDSPLSWVASQASKPGRGDEPSYVLHGSAGWSEANRELEPEAVVVQLLQALAEALAASLPPVEHAVAHRWLYALPSAPLADEMLWDAGAGVGACGDWLCGARLEAAVESGEALAAAIAAEPG